MRTQLAITAMSMIFAYLWLSGDPRFQELVPVERVREVVIIIIDHD